GGGRAGAAGRAGGVGAARHARTGPAAAPRSPEPTRPPALPSSRRPRVGRIRRDAHRQAPATILATAGGRSVPGRGAFRYLSSMLRVRSTVRRYEAVNAVPAAPNSPGGHRTAQ